MKKKKNRNSFAVIILSLFAFIFLIIFIQNIFIKSNPKSTGINLLSPTPTSITSISDSNNYSIDIESENAIRTLSDLIIPGSTPISQKEISTEFWSEFSDSEVGIYFKYPTNWGNPKKIFGQGDTGNYYSIEFPNSYFQIRGMSVDFTAGRSGGIYDFRGFNSYSDFRTPDDVCKFRDIIFCQVVDNTKVHVLFGMYEPLEFPYFSFFDRFLLFDRPGYKISGLVFGGVIIPEDFSSKIEQYIYQDDKLSTEKKRSEIYNAILNRINIGNSVETMDTFEKVFETVRNI